MENKQKILNMIGLAQKAGKVASGEFSTEKAVKEHKAYMVIVADDSSDNTKKNFRNMCEYYKVPVYFFSLLLSISVISFEEIFNSFASS